jgi:hypothetical protein
MDTIKRIAHFMHLLGLFQVIILKGKMHIVSMQRNIKSDRQQIHQY